MKRLKKYFVLGFVALISIMALAGCSSDDNQAYQSGEVSVKVSNISSSDVSKVRLKVLNEDKEVVEDVDINNNQNIAKLELSEGVYSIQAIEYQEASIKEDEEVYEILNIGDKNNLVVKGNEATSTTIELTSLMEYSRQHNSNIPPPVQEDQTVKIAGVTGSYTTPFDSWCSVYNSYTWSNEASWDLSNESIFSDDAVITIIKVRDAYPDGSFTGLHVAVFNEEGKGYYIDSLTKDTDGFAGEPLKQEWSVRFWVESLSGTPMMAPKLSLHYEIL